MSAPVREGEVLAGKYRIERVLGEGGMGVVVAATHIQLEQRVAIKFLLPQAMEIPEVVSRFAREARAAAKIQSEHVARVIDVATLETGAPYMVMEYLEGKDLAQVLDERGPLPVAEAAEYALQASEALAEAHAAGIVHRDLKPANLFLARRADRTSIVKVLDFGISKALNGGATDGVQTKTSALMGSPFYMSPEQMTNSRNVDARSDVWAMGVILYELTTGKTPFFGESMPEIVAAILSASPAPMNEVQAGLGDEIQAVVSRCLEKSPKDRYANVAELAAALASLSTHEKAQLSVARISRVLGSEPPPPVPRPVTKAPVPAIPATLVAGVAPPQETPTPSSPPPSAEARGSVQAKTVGSATAGAWGASSAPEEPKKSGGKGMLVGLAVAATVVVVGGGALLFGNKKPSAASPDPTPSSVVTAAPASTGALAPTATTIEKLTPPEPTVVVPPAVESATSESRGTKPPAHATHAAVAVTTKPTASAAPTQQAAPPPTTPPATTSKSPLNIQLK